MVFTLRYMIGRLRYTYLNVSFHNSNVKLDKMPGETIDTHADLLNGGESRRHFSVSVHPPSPKHNFDHVLMSFENYFIPRKELISKTKARDFRNSGNLQNLCSLLCAIYCSLHIWWD